ncbi:hypothetical protein DDZ18_11990 [Marinicauda salina]|uniref:AB hydrolase-1 domain-containing protein n=1 Tax=Marinicauda salina TaxID=2135793 RepID=A0A2U2BR74_9PROT|nr:alpha/beta fold hydrolase [Marinicauda salina]PWE16489.1 hypothetical protein DDZ18_11990 [Marinicauda salina]
MTVAKPAIWMANLSALINPAGYKRVAGKRFVTPRKRSQTDRGREFVDSLEAGWITGPLGRQRVHAGGDGPLVLFQHGWEADSADLSTLAEAVMKAGFAVALIDGPAHGASEGERATMVDFAAGLGAAAAELGRPHAVVAHSMGTPATVVAMRDHGLAPAAVVSLGAPNALPDNVAFQGRAMGLSGRAIRLLLEAIEFRMGRPAEEFRVERDAPAFSARALIVHGTNDRIAPPVAAERIAAAWPGAELALFDDLGHRGVLRDQAVLERVVGFLKDG